MNMKKAVLLLLALVLVFASTVVAGADDFPDLGEGAVQIPEFVETPDEAVTSCAEWGIRIKDPTCTEKGICRHCYEDAAHTIPTKHKTDNPNYFVEHLIDKVPHTWKYLPGEDPLPQGYPCGAQGTLYETCTVCGEKSGKTQLTALKPHDLVKKYDKEGCNVATCIAKEHYYELCTVCGYTSEIKEGEINPDNHNFGDWIWDTEPPKDCMTTGLRYRLCYDCRQVREDEVVPPLAHDADMEHPVFLSPDDYPDCEKEGKATYYCKYGCGTPVFEDVPLAAFGHLDSKIEVIDEPTCYSVGHQRHICLREIPGPDNTSHICGDTVTTEFVKDENKLTMYNGEIVEIIPKLPHNWGEWVERNEYVEGHTLGYWVRECENEGCYEQDFKIAENTEDNWVKENVVDPTCDKAGSFDLVLYKGDGKTELARKTVEVPATGHKYIKVEDECVAPTCTTEGKTVEVCRVCAYTNETVLPVTDHTLETVPAKAPTGGASGNQEYQICTVCKKAFKDGKEINPADMIIAPKGGLSNEDGSFKYYDENGKVMTSFTGLVDFEGGKFFIRNGVLDTTVNGPQSPDAKNFYFFSNGQICDSYTGLALYNNKWFVVEKGVFKTGYNGLYEYDGAKFWIAAGQKTDANGLVQTAEGWLYMRDGMVIDYTGLARYDGEVFYVKGGKLQEDFTGKIKDFNGTEFEIVNGMAK